MTMSAELESEDRTPMPVGPHAMAEAAWRRANAAADNALAAYQVATRVEGQVQELSTLVREALSARHAAPLPPPPRAPYESIHDVEEVAERVIDRKKLDSFRYREKTREDERRDMRVARLGFIGAAIIAAAIEVFRSIHK